MVENGFSLILSVTVQSLTSITTILTREKPVAFVGMKMVDYKYQ